MATSQLARLPLFEAGDWPDVAGSPDSISTLSNFPHIKGQGFPTDKARSFWYADSKNSCRGRERFNRDRVFDAGLSSLLYHHLSPGTTHFARWTQASRIRSDTA